MSSKPLQQEIKKKRPFEVAEEEAALNILRTADQLQNRFLRLFRQFGLTPSQYNVLRILRGEGTPLPCQEIASRMLQVVPAMTGLIDRLEAAELVCRDRCTEDRRVIYIALTPAGLKLVNHIDAPLQQLHRELLGHMEREELASLSTLLQKARQMLLTDVE